MSNLENAKVSVKKILDCNTLIECQNNLQDILNDVGFHDQPSDLVDNDDYIQLINYIDDLMKISISGPSTDNIDDLTNLLQDPKTDIYNPNIIRSSLGYVFSLPIIIDTSKNIINFLKSNKIKIIVAEINEKSIYHD